jgi:hypothetical protein
MAMRKTTILVMMTALSACNGTRTGNPIDPGDSSSGSGKNGGVMTTNPGSGDNGGVLGSEGAIGNCDPKPSDLDSGDAKTKLGFSASDILAYAAGVHETKIRWGEGSSWTFGPETGERGLRIEITPRSDKPRFVAYEERKSNGDENIGTADIALPYGDCSELGAVEIDVDVKVKSEGGALDESGKATLRATKSSWATLSLDLDAEDIHGSLVLRDSKPAGFVLDAITVALDFSPFGVRGGLQTTLTMPASGDDSMNGVSTGGAAGRGGAGSIGDSADCDDGGFVVALDAKLNDFAAQDAIDRVGALQDVAFGWAGGAMARAAFAFEPEGTDACAVLDPGWLLDSNDEGVLRVHGTLHVTTDDERVDAEWPVVLEGHGNADGSLGDVTLELHTPDLLDAMTLDVEAQYGISDIDSTGFDAVRVQFLVRIPAGEDVANGMLIVNGIEHAVCPQPDPNIDPNMGTPGCRGDDITNLASATFGTGDASDPDAEPPIGL